MHWLNQHKLLLLLLLATVLVRLPNLNRPLSKHHEFNTAVTLTNAASWREAGGGTQYSFTPLMNYQGYANKLWEEGPHVDSAHNHVYISIGAGMFVLPYAVMKILHLPFTALVLQLINILISLLTVVLFYRLLYGITQKRQTALLSTALFGFLPAVLWYGGNGYVNTVIMLPLVLMILKVWHQLETANNSGIAKQLVKLFVLSILLIYFDWYAVFLTGMLSLWAIVKSLKQRGYLVIAATGIVSIAVGILIVLWQYAIYFGWDKVMQYWVARFTDRSTDTSRFSFAAMCVMIIKNLLTGYWPLLLLLPLLFIKKRSLDFAKMKWPLWALASIIPYNGLFFNWSAEHEFAWLAFALVVSICVALYIIPTMKIAISRFIVLTAVFVSMGIYYFINRPGKTSWNGDVYASQMQLGRWIQSHADSKIPLFTNLANDKIVEYYSRRTFNTAYKINEVIKICRNYSIPSATWLEIENNKVVKQVLILMKS